ncbi:histidine kinase [Leptobacterium flavescens]|uniref:Histidine kinase n=1 Tax=Leptobacterium flavescens TaxID=472055 RepID=A0A6P0UJ94_9FLAO|nr:sensor histidine kinase [Leptobacterium flavescens]NER12460.1 histidine kinase [Leptobacterium flavescens]
MEVENNFLDRILQNRVLGHILFWAFVLFSAPFTSDGSLSGAGDAFLYRAVALPSKMAATYLLAYYQIPRLFQKKKYIQFIISFAISTLVFCIIYRYNNIHIAEALAGSPEPRESLGQIIRQLDFTISSYFFRVYFFGFIFIFIKMVKARNLEKREMEILQKEKATTELNFLKAQIHPHFLFNTLNNLYALTLNKSDKAPDVVAKLSEILDYMLYQCKEDKVLIGKEVELLEHYIDLEKLRYGKRLHLDFKYDIEDQQLLIAPLILISIVENAFKHGVSGTIQQAVIQVILEAKKDQLYFRVYNSKSDIEHSDEMNYKEGIGVKNVKRQLELIYPGQYEWKVQENKKSYEVNLWIQV